MCVPKLQLRLLPGRQIHSGQMGETVLGKQLASGKYECNYCGKEIGGKTSTAKKHWNSFHSPSAVKLKKEKEEAVAKATDKNTKKLAAKVTPGGAKKNRLAEKSAIPQYPYFDLLALDYALKGQPTRCLVSWRTW